MHEQLAILEANKESGTTFAVKDDIAGRCGFDRFMLTSLSLMSPKTHFIITVFGVLFQEIVLGGVRAHNTVWLVCKFGNYLSPILVDK